MASYSDITNILNFSVSLARTSAFPIDAHAMFGSKADAEAAASKAEAAGSSNTVYYYGMPVYVFENDQASMYIINGDNTLKSVGTVVYGDNKSIVLDANSGTLSLKSFGQEYYAYHEADDANPDAYYEKVTGWKEGLQPRVIGNDSDGYSLAWYESSTTLEELSNTVQSNINNINNQINSIDRSIDIMNDKINNIIDGVPDEFNTLQKVYNWIQNNKNEMSIINDNILSNATAIKAIRNLIGDIPESSTSTTIIEYIAEIANNLEDKINTAKQNIIDYANETFIPKVNIVSSKSISEGSGNPSDEKIPSEKLLMEMFTWKTSM